MKKGQTCLFEAKSGTQIGGGPGNLEPCPFQHKNEIVPKVVPLLLRKDFSLTLKGHGFKKFLGTALKPRFPLSAMIEK